MPKFVKAGAGWQSVAVPGEFANDANFGFLSAFEELVYKKQEVSNPVANRIKKKKKQKLLQKKKSAINKLNDGKKKKISKKRKIKNVIIDQGSSNKVELTSSDGLIERTKEAETGEYKQKKLATKRLKRKKPKKAKISFEEPKKKTRLEDREPVVGAATVKTDDASTSSELNVPEINLSLWHDFFLPDEIMRALKDLRFSAPTEIQSLVLPSAVRDKLDILGAAETGSGKTLAFIIPLICRLLEMGFSSDKVGPKALILAPTRELVIQIKKQLDSLLKYTKFKGTTLVGGLSQQKQERLLKRCPHIIVATPGRFWALADAATPDSYLSDWSDVQVVVVDETDRMMEKGHFDELQLILSRIKCEAPVKHQTLVFSATLTFVHLPSARLDIEQSGTTSADKLKNLINFMGLRAERKIFDITKPFCTPEKLMEARMNCSDLLEKDGNVLYLLTRYPGRTLIFTNSIDASHRLYGILSKLLSQRKVLMLHAKMIQKQRLKNLEKFSGDDNSVLLATDVAARGLDIPCIQHVIHYQVSKTAESYIHRSGRTARISQKGLTILMLDSQDVKYYMRICRNLGRKSEFPVFPVDNLDLMKALRARVEAAAEVDLLEHRIRKIVSRENWFTKAAEEADLLDDRNEEKEVFNTEVKNLRCQKNVAESKMKALLAQELPNFDRRGPLNTRYITPEVVSSYEEEVTKDALVSLKESESKKKSLKGKVPRLFSTWQVLKLGKNTKKKKKATLKRW